MNKEAQEKQIAWLESILLEKSTTLTKLAKDAGISPSTLTRLVKRDTPFALTWTTIGKIEKYTGIKFTEPPAEELDADIDIDKFTQIAAAFIDFKDEKSLPLNGRDTVEILLKMQNMISEPDFSEDPSKLVGVAIGMAWAKIESNKGS